MLFAEIIREAGINCEEFKNSSYMEINLYDSKDRISSKQSINFVEPLFKHNEGSKKNFKNFLTGFEYETIESMNVKIDADSVILFYKSPRAIVFLRVPPLNPMDRE